MKNYKKIILFTIIAIIEWLIIGWLIYIGNYSIEVSEFIICNNKIPKAFNNYKILQVSDLHNKEFGKNQSEILNKIKQLSPDIIVITGDLVNRDDIDFNVAMDFIKGSLSYASVYYVDGNHEASNKNYKILYDELIYAGVKVLKNESIILEKENENIFLCGVEDPLMYPDYSVTNYEIMQNFLSNINLDQTKFNILLSHRPELIDLYAKYNYDLVFAGHAHGGQFRIPLIGGIFAPGQGFFPKYTSGVHSIDNTLLIVNRGLGDSIIPLRILNKPELVFCKLQVE